MSNKALLENILMSLMLIMLFAVFCFAPELYGN